MSRSERFRLPPNYETDTLPWLRPAMVVALVAVVALGAYLRFVGLGHDLPVNQDTAEPYYYMWAHGVRYTGYPTLLYPGVGYPPLSLYMLAAEQVVTDWVRGDALNPSGDYYMAGRVVSATISLISIVVLFELTRRISRSTWAALAAAAAQAVWGLAVLESRRANSTPPWLLLTLLALLFMVVAVQRDEFWWLYPALVCATASWLFQYQSVAINGMPIVLALWSFRDKVRHFWWHMLGWTLALAALAAWLFLDWQILAFFEIESNHVAGVAQTSGGLLRFQSLTENLSAILVPLVGGHTFWLWSAALFSVGALALWVARPAQDHIDAFGALFPAGLFGAYYVTMGVFIVMPMDKWLIALPLVLLLAMSGLFVGLRLLVAWVAPRFVAERYLPAVTHVVQALAFAGLVLWGVQYFTPQWRFYINDYWTATPTVSALNAWFDAHVPQGGRVVEEANKHVQNYVWNPATIHSFETDSIFEEPVQAWRERGYEYLVWNNLKSAGQDQLADLETPERQAYLAGVDEVLRLEDASPDFYGNDFVVYAIPPLQQHVRYAWFGSDLISFRGYDLSSDTLAPGETLALTLYWMSVQPTDADYIVFVHLWDPATGQMVAQRDSAPGGGFNRTWQWQGNMQFHIDPHAVPLPDDAAPGTYELRIGMYDAGTGERLPIFAVSGDAPPRDFLLLDTITIEP